MLGGTIAAMNQDEDTFLEVTDFGIEDFGFQESSTDVDEGNKEEEYYAYVCGWY